MHKLSLSLFVEVVSHSKYRKNNAKVMLHLFHVWNVIVKFALHVRSNVNNAIKLFAHSLFVRQLPINYIKRKLSVLSVNYLILLKIIISAFIKYLAMMSLVPSNETE